MYGYQATQLISVFYALIRIQVSPGNSGNEAAQVQGEMQLSKKEESGFTWVMSSNI